MVVGVFEQTMLVIIFHDGEGPFGNLEPLHLCHQGCDKRVVGVVTS